jgi:hypothetical protein
MEYGDTSTVALVANKSVTYSCHPEAKIKKKTELI